WNFLTGGAESETTLKRNRQALDSLAFRPRVLRKVDSIDMTAALLGQTLTIPVLLAPLGSLQQLNPQGALPAARAAAAFGVPTILSSVTMPEVDAIKPLIDGPMIYQLYVRGDDAWVMGRVGRAVELGSVGFCLTVDSAVYARRERDLEKRFTPVARTLAGGADYQAGMTWD